MSAFPPGPSSPARQSASQLKQAKDPKVPRPPPPPPRREKNRKRRKRSNPKPPLRPPNRRTAMELVVLGNRDVVQIVIIFFRSLPFSRSLACRPASRVSGRASNSIATPLSPKSRSPSAPSAFPWQLFAPLTFPHTSPRRRQDAPTGFSGRRDPGKGVRLPSLPPPLLPPLNDGPSTRHGTPCSPIVIKQVNFFHRPPPLRSWW